MTDPRVSVVIRCFNEECHIGTLLEHVYRQTVRNPQVIVVDSGSTDGTLGVVSRFPAHVVRITPDEFTFGFSLNQGCRVAAGEYLVVASAHVVPCGPDWIEQLVAPFSDPRVALVYGRQVGDERTKFSEHRQFARQFPAESNLDQRNPFCNNANAAVRRSLWLERGYDESLSGLEDLEWAQWALGQGHRVAYSAQAGVVHVHEETPAQIRRRYMREAIALKHIVPDSHVYFTEFVRVLLSSIGTDLLAALRERKLAQNAFDIFMFRAMQYWGTYRGMNHRSPLTHELIMQFYYPRRPQRASSSPPESQVSLGPSYDPPRR
jgi:glycosyltransferase involved in cell wall biosynthesis